MDSIVKMPYGFLTGPNQLYGDDPATNKLYPMEEDGFGTYNLATIMGGGEVVFELNDLVEHPGWKKVWNQGPDVLNPIEEVAALSTNSVSQGCLEAIEVLEMCGDRMG